MRQWCARGGTWGQEILNTPYMLSNWCFLNLHLDFSQGHKTIFNSFVSFPSSWVLLNFASLNSASGQDYIKSAHRRCNPFIWDSKEAGVVLSQSILLKVLHDAFNKVQTHSAAQCDCIQWNAVTQTHLSLVLHPTKWAYDWFLLCMYIIKGTGVCVSHLHLDTSWFTTTGWTSAHLL